jgi:hypothetical protein
MINNFYPADRKKTTFIKNHGKFVGDVLGDAVMGKNPLAIFGIQKQI